MSTWLLTMKLSFCNEWSALPPKEAAQVLKKLEILTEDPTPQAKVKLQLKGWDGKLYRLRSGDFRIFYTFEKPHVSLLALRRRQKDTYDEEIEAELLGGGSVDLPEAAAPPDAQWTRWLAAAAPAPQEARALAAPITSLPRCSMRCGCRPNFTRRCWPCAARRRCSIPRVCLKRCGCV